MTIRRREAKSGTRWDVEWLLPDGTKRSKTFKTIRAAKLFDGELRSVREDGEAVDPRGGKIELRLVYKSWLASRPDLSPKVRRGYEDNWRLRIEPKFGNWPIGRILRENVQEWVNEMTAAGLGPRTVRWTHSVLRMTLDHAITDKKLRGKNPASNVRFPAMGETSHVYLTAVEVAKLAELCDTATGEDSRATKQGDVVLILAYTGLRFGELTGLNLEDVDLEARRIRVRRSITQLSGRLLEGPPKSRAGRRSVPIPERLVPRSSNAGSRGAQPASRRSCRRKVRGSGSRTGSAPLAGVPGSPNSGVPRCACTTSDTPTLLYRDRPAPT